MTWQLFFAWLVWASHHSWVVWSGGYAGDSLSGNARHIVYGGSLSECWSIARQIGGSVVFGQ